MSRRNRSTRIAGSRVAAASLARPGYATCADMTQATSAATARKGSRSASRVSLDAPTCGSSACESVVVRPWPGKCFAQAATPTSWQASIHARPSIATRSGSGPKLRVPTIGFRGSTSRSRTGASARLRPSPRASRAVVRAANRTASSASGWWDRAPGGGNVVRPRRCWPAPRSRSAASHSGRSVASRISSATRAAASARAPKKMNPPTSIPRAAWARRRMSSTESKSNRSASRNRRPALKPAPACPGCEGLRRPSPR